MNLNVYIELQPTGVDLCSHFKFRPIHSYYGGVRKRKNIKKHGIFQTFGNHFYA